MHDLWLRGLVMLKVTKIKDIFYDLIIWTEKGIVHRSHCFLVLHASGLIIKKVIKILWSLYTGLHRRACGHVDVGTCPHQVLAATLTLSQPRGARLCPPYTALVSSPSFESHRRACLHEVMVTKGNSS